MYNRSYYRVAGASMNKTAKTQQPAQEYTAEQVWTAAAYATRINGGYFKDGVWAQGADGEQIRVKEPNRDIVRLALNQDSQTSDLDRDLGLRARDWLSKNLVIRAIKGSLNDFESQVSRVCAKESFTSNDRLEIAVIASQVQSYLVGSRMEEAMSDVDRSPLADVGAKVQANLQVLKAVYSQKYNVYFITGKTDTNHMVFFSNREKFDAGTHLTIRGTVKAHRDDATQLNRVKVL